MLGVRLQVADIRLGVATRSVQQDEHRFGRIARAQVAGSHATGVQVALLERDALQIAPHAFVLGHRFLSGVPVEILFSSCVNRCVLKSHTQCALCIEHHSLPVVCQGRRRSLCPVRFWCADMGEPLTTQTVTAPGSQTLARGLNALQLVAEAPSGLTVQQVADGVGVHRTIAYRLLDHAGPIPIRRQGRGRALPAGCGPGGSRCVVRPQCPPAECADPASLGRRPRHHGVVAGRRG